MKDDELRKYVESRVREWLGEPVLAVEDELMALISQQRTEAAIHERNEVALDNYRGHTFSDSTDWRGKFDKFIKNNEKRLKQLQSSQGEG